MATVEVVAVSQQQSALAAVDAQNAPAKSKSGRPPAWKRRREKKAAALVVTQKDTTIVQVTELKKKGPKEKKQDGAEQKQDEAETKQDEAEVEATQAAAEPPNGVKITSPPEVAQVTRITKSKAARKVLPRDKVTVPSAESGGVPEPSNSYLRRAGGPVSRLLRPRRILVVMDLNGTLLYRPNKARAPSRFVARPHARVFMDYLLRNFAVAVWSSARPENVNCMVASLLTPEQRRACVVVWGRDRFGLSSEDYDARVQCYKRLTRVWADPKVAAAHPDAGRRGGAAGRWDQSNTVLVDDSTEKARSEPHNLLRIPEYLGPDAESPFVLPQVHDYINELAYQANISRYIREKPFQLDSNYSLS
ncbi:NIF domain protein [Cordyceps fumosorosea ARSEF 2679]|uniref:Mitochondrial import inner membrane translocase subunit TIM50 n=1 Tax=Cordyceps fumosorosea (strain ARSEF 2679) TaxID=1081104 RepID=A0A162JNS6_CORFA|nr:NIF domain protein [Cordyceps fumosorosea ARSEF 2679]OAA71592.1 NIF domain protein [Cordyceps fumosorosea ARSEF 2679]